MKKIINVCCNLKKGVIFRDKKINKRGGYIKGRREYKLM